MPEDGTTPVLVEITYEAFGGKFIASPSFELPTVQQQRPLQVLYSPPAQFPPSAMSNGIEGTVDLRVKVDKEGTVTDAEIVRGPEVLRQSAVETVRQWRFKPDTSLPREIKVSMSFNIAGR